VGHGCSYAACASDILGRTAATLDLNGMCFLNSSTVQDDHSANFLAGSTGRDWFFAETAGETGPRDVVLDAHANEVVIKSESK
jgi:hypothetical protein